MNFLAFVFIRLKVHKVRTLQLRHTACT